MYMDYINPLSIIVIWVCVFFLGQWIYRQFRNRDHLKSFPGPWIARYSNLWIVKAAFSGRSGEEYMNVIEKYGLVARIGPNHLITGDEEFVRRMSAVRSPYVRSDWYSAFKFDADQENVFSETNDARHTAMRKKLSPAYSGKENSDLEPMIDQVIRDLISLLERRYLSSSTEYRPLDFARIAQYFTLDVISGLAYSKPFGWLTNETDMYSFIDTAHASLPNMYILSSLPWFLRLMKQRWFLRLSLPTVKDAVGMGAVKGVAQKLVVERFDREAQREGKGQDMLASFMAHGLTVQECADEGLLQIIAGSDTTASAIRLTMLQILTHPTCYAKLIKEIDRTVRKHALSTDQIIPDSIATGLPYLQAVIKESLRLIPPIGGLVTKVSPPEGDTLPDGTFIPGNVLIGASASAPMRNAAVFGPDVDIFRPERFLEAASEPDRRTKMDLAQDLVFGSGRFSCLGKHIAKIELGKVMFELFRRFEWGVNNGLKPINSVRMYGLFIHKGFWVRVERRDGNWEEL